MLNGSGQVDTIVCPLHRWTYDLEGQLLGAPHFGDKPCLHLGKSPLQNWQGMLFEGPRDVVKDLGKLGVADDLDFTGYMLDHIEVHECNYNWNLAIGTAYRRWVSTKTSPIQALPCIANGMTRCSATMAISLRGMVLFG
jgi:phenylpropionate dioxygenase-like ring-hydroxylating dioxygenase large terminal subunit